MASGGCMIPANKISIDEKNGLITAAMVGVVEKDAIKKPNEMEKPKKVPKRR